MLGIESLRDAYIFDDQLEKLTNVMFRRYDSNDDLLIETKEMDRLILVNNFLIFQGYYI